VSTWLFCWELGGGWGHVAPFRLPIERLLERGHQVMFAARDVASLPRLFRGLDVRWLQAPHSVATSVRRTNPARTYAEILHNVGWGDADELAALVSAWRNLIDAVEPDALVLDQAPTALLAARGMKLPTVLSGTGFASPPAVDPLPPLLPTTNAADGKNVEQRVLAHARLCCGPGLAPASLGELFQGADATLLLSYAELDHYPSRREGRYFGVWDFGGAEIEPTWPAGERRVFGYWKSFPAEQDLIEGLAERGLSSLIVHADPPTMESHEQVRFESRPVRLNRAARDATLAISNGSFYTTARCLQHGVPVLLIPLTVEQWLLSQRVVASGAGLIAPFDQPAELLAKLDAMLSTSAFTEAAHRLAARWSPIDEDAAVTRYVTALQQVLK